MCQTCSLQLHSSLYWQIRAWLRKPCTRRECGGAHRRHLANTAERSLCDGDATLSQIALTTYFILFFYYSDFVNALFNSVTLLSHITAGWLCSRVVSVLDTGAEERGFKSQPRRLGETVHTQRASVHQSAKLVAALLKVARVTAGLAESNGSLPPGL